jgi:hypothetical protein
MFVFNRMQEIPENGIFLGGGMSCFFVRSAFLLVVLLDLS